MFQSQVLGGAMLLLGGCIIVRYLFKLPYNDAERNQVPTLLWLHDNIIPVFQLMGGVQVS